MELPRGQVSRPSNIARQSGSDVGAGNPSHRAVFNNLPRDMANNPAIIPPQDRVGVPLRATKVPHGMAQRRDHVPEYAQRGVTLRKSATAGAASRLPSSFSYIAPLLHRPARAVKSTPVPPTWMAHEEVEADSSSRKRNSRDPSNRSARITAVVPTSRHPQPTPFKTLLVKQPGDRISMLPRKGFVVGPADLDVDSSEEEDDDDEERLPSMRPMHVAKVSTRKTMPSANPQAGVSLTSTGAPRMQLTTKSARKTAPSGGAAAVDEASDKEETYPGERPRKKLLATKSARKTAPISIIHADESSDDSGENRISRKPGRKPPKRMQLATKSAREASPFVKLRMDESLDESEESRASGKQRAGITTKGARKSIPSREQTTDPFADAIEISDSSSSFGTSTPTDDKEDVERLMNALDALTLPVVRLREYKRLPFLLRNLRRGFKHRCRLAGVPTGHGQPFRPSHPVTVLYRYKLDNVEALGENSDDADEYEEWTGSMNQWECPLCQLYGRFNSREMLSFHLQCDHNEVEVTWQETRDYSASTMRLVLVIPDPHEEEFESESELEDEEIVPETDDTDMGIRMPSEPTAAAHLGPSSALWQGSDERTTIDLTGIPPSPILIPKKFRADSPPPLASTDLRRSSTIQSQQRTTSIRGSLPARYPTPPPPFDPLAPAAQYPYLPEAPEGGNVYYSCRPGGPRIFDLLNTLPMEPFGVLAWQIIEREEELFERDNVRDEDKVMLALWNRWIMLNRISFVYNGYEKGVTAFIDEYWRMIHRAAGWGALRGFLLMLVATRFLDVAEVIRILKHYETHTGMDYWYKDDE